GNSPRSEAHRQARVPVDRRAEERHAQGGAADSARRPEPHLGPAQGAQPAVAGRSDGTAPRQDGQDEVELRIPVVNAENGVEEFGIQNSEFGMRTRYSEQGGVWRISK